MNSLCGRIKTHNKAVKDRQQAGWISLRSAAYGGRYVSLSSSFSILNYS